MERLYLGKRGEFWGVHHWPSGNQTDFRGGTSQFRQVFNNKTQNTPSWDNVKWVAFGCADESYFSIVPDVWMLGSCTSLSDSIKRSSGSGGGVSVSSLESQFSIQILLHDYVASHCVSVGEESMACRQRERIDRLFPANHHCQGRSGIHGQTLLPGRCASPSCCYAH